MKRRISGLLVLIILAQTLGTRGFPDSLNIGLAEPITNLQSWVRKNRNDHWMFEFILNPFISVVEFGIELVESVFTWLPWFVPAIIVFALVARTRRWGLATFTAFAVIYPGVVGVWSQSIVTISLMAVAVFICVLIGVPLGVLAALRPRVEVALRPILDGMQTVPATVYLIPIVLLFGIGPAPAAIATVIYALPPMVRLTALGIQQVPKSAVEAAQMFGATKRQILAKVQLPLAVPSIITGINQTVMMALGIVVIATLVGAGGLGQEINQTVRRLEPGRGLVVSLAVVAVALVLDRVSMSLVSTPGAQRVRIKRNTLYMSLSGLALVAIVGRLLGWVKFPFSWGTSFADPIDTGFKWFRTTFNVVTRPFNDFIVREILIRAQTLFNETITWQAVVVVAAAFAFYVAGWKLSLFTACGVTFIGLTGRWLDAVDTLTQTVVAVLISILIALPIGIWIGRRPRIEAIIAPVLDAFQTIPNLVYA
ncbi:MAG: ABC transporter permease subunit, partial [Acidimicrobiaceae bacterium]